MIAPTGYIATDYTMSATLLSPDTSVGVEMIWQPYTARVSSGPVITTVSSLNQPMTSKTFRIPTNLNCMFCFYSSNDNEMDVEVEVSGKLETVIRHSPNKLKQRHQDPTFLFAPGPGDDCFHFKIGRATDPINSENVLGLANPNSNGSIVFRAYIEKGGAEMAFKINNRSYPIRVNLNYSLKEVLKYRGYDEDNAIVRRLNGDKIDSDELCKDLFPIGTDRSINLRLKSGNMHTQKSRVERGTVNPNFSKQVVPPLNRQEDWMQMMQVIFHLI